MFLVLLSSFDSYNKHFNFQNHCSSLFALSRCSDYHIQDGIEEGSHDFLRKTSCNLT